MKDKILETDFAGLKLCHPIIAASAGSTKDAEHALRAQKAGFSAVILKSIQEEMVNRYNPFPRFAVIRNGVAGYNSTSFMSYEQAFEGGIEEYAKEIEKTKSEINIPVIASVNCVNVESWALYAKICEQAGADAVEIVPSCPVGMLMREASEFGPVAVKAVKEAKKFTSIPVGIKMTQQLSNPISCAVDLEQCGADWITMFNRTPGIQIDLDTMRPIMHGGIAGHGGPWVVQSVMRWIIGAKPYLNVPISATGGVTRWEDVMRYILCGASTVQVASLVYIKGYNVVNDMIDQIKEYLDKKGTHSIAELIGSASEHVKTLDQVDRSHQYFAQVDPKLCIKCRKCKDICIYDAIQFSVGEPTQINKELCDGCGLCAQICNRAINMKIKE